MIRPPYRGTRRGEKQRKRLFYQLVDEVRAIFRRLFPRATWVRIEFSSNTQALQAALESIVANPQDGLNPAWHAVAAFSPTLRRFIPAGALQGAAVPPPPAAEEDAEEEQPDNEPGQASGETLPPQAPEEGAPSGIAEEEPASAAAVEAAADPELQHPPADSAEPDLADANAEAEEGDLDNALAEEGVSAAAAEGVVLEGGAAAGAPGVGDAQEEEPLEQDEFVEVEVDSDTLSIYQPLPPSDDEDLHAEPSSSAAAPAAHSPAPVGSGSLSSRSPLGLRPRQPGYPPVRIDREGTWERIGGPLAQPEPVHPPAPEPAFPSFQHEAADPYSLPDSAWLDPASFARSQTLQESAWESRITSLRLRLRVLPQAHRVPDAGPHQHLPPQKPGRQRAEGCLWKRPRSRRCQRRRPPFLR